MASLETSPVSTDVDPLLRQRQLAGIQEAVDYNNPDALAQALNIQAVDLSSGVAAESRDSADEYLREQTTQRGMGGFLKRIWHGNIARDFIRQREVRRGQNEIVSSNNLYVRHEGTAEDHQRAAEAVVSRFTSEYDGSIHAGESNQEAETLRGGDVFRSEVDQLIRSYARGDLTDASLEIEKNRIVANFGQQRHDFDRNKGLLWADNILAVARNARGAFEHSVSLDDIQHALSVRVGEARMGVRTEASKELVDRAIDKLYGTRVGSLVNETTLSLGVAITLAATKRTVTSAASAAMRTLGFGVGAGITAGVREAHHVTQERRLHSRQMAEGGEIEDDIPSRRREQMEHTRYETVAASELIGSLQAAQEQHAASPDADTARGLLGTLIEARTRVSMSDELGSDFISYSSKELVEQERMDLDVAIARARAELQRVVDDSDDATLQSITGDTDRSLPDILDRGAGIYRSAVEGDVSQKDVAFRRLQLSRAAKAAVIGAAVGGVMGFASQELRAVFDGGMQGLGEQFQQGQDRLMELAALAHGTHHVAQGKMHNLDFVHSGFKVGDNALDLPPGYHVVHESTGYELIGPDKHAIGPVAFDSKGGLDSATQVMLERHGFKLDTTTEAFSTVHTETSTSDVSFDQYMRAHPDRFAPIHRQFWYNSNLPDPNSANNAGRLLWGGQNGTGIDAQGNYVLDMSHMTPGGSFHDGFSANAQELLKEHKLYIAISATKGTQFNVIYVPINEHGQAVFDPHDPLFKSLFSTESGHAHFNGAYAEVVQDMGKTSDGGMSVRMLATVVGSNHPNAVQETVQAAIRTTGEHIVTHLGAPAEAGLPVEIAPVIPIRSRKGMEGLTEEGGRRPENPEPGPNDVGYGYYANAYSAEALRRYGQYRSPRLEADHNARLDTGTEVAWYLDEIREESGGEDYVRQLNEIVQDTPELRDLGSGAEALICMPVAAASEADNIYGTLSLYAQQSPASKQRAKMLLHVNWFDDAEADTAKRRDINRTLAEIERARRDFPDLSIAVFTTKWDRATYSTKGIIYHVVNKLYDVALTSIDHAIKTGQRASDQEILIIRNDADAQGMARDYIERELRAATEHPETDAFVSASRQGTKEHTQYPGFGVVVNMREVIDQVKSLLHRGVSTIGTNTAIRASALAATGSIRRDDGYTGAGSDDLEIGNRIYAARSSTYGGQTPDAAGAGLVYSGSSPDSVAATADYVGRTAGSVADSGRRIAYVRGAQVDVNADRLLNTYSNNRPITDAWNDFDKGGHMDRMSVGGGRNARSVQQEDTTDIDEIAHRIEMNYSAMFRIWGQNDRDVVRVALGLAHGQGNDIYNVAWNADGQCEFHFTDKGRQWLKDRLERDGRGQPDPFGDRVRRRLYGEVSPRSSKLPLSRTSRFLKPLSV